MKRFLTVSLSMVAFLAVVGCGEKKDNNNGGNPPPPQCAPGTGTPYVPCQPYTGQCQPGTGVGNVPCQPIYPQQAGTRYQGVLTVTDSTKATDALNCRVYFWPQFSNASYNACGTIRQIQVDVMGNGQSAQVQLISDFAYWSFATNQFGRVGMLASQGNIFPVNNGGGFEIDVRSGYSVNVVAVIGQAAFGQPTMNVELKFNQTTFATGTLTLRPY